LNFSIDLNEKTVRVLNKYLDLFLHCLLANAVKVHLNGAFLIRLQAQKRLVDTNSVSVAGHDWMAHLVAHVAGFTMLGSLKRKFLVLARLYQVVS
jgi:hypothetical protein